ncbi:MAG: SDR family oxidoreductase [Nannocystaceae bacterium]
METGSGAQTSMAGKTVVVTGGNAGIGEETALALARRGARVIFTARNPARGAAALSGLRERSGSELVELVDLDLASLASVRACADELRRRCPTIDVLINNAGLMLSRRAETADGLEMTLGVNHFGHFALTLRLVDRLVAGGGGRVVVVASDAHRLARAFDFDDLHARRRYSGMKAYSQSKLANVLFARELAARLDGRGVTVNALHPGLVRSSFAGGGDVSGAFAAFFALCARVGGISSAKGAQTSVHLACSPEVALTTGEYFYRCAPRRPAAAAQDAEAARRLWELSEALTGERLER